MESNSDHQIKDAELSVLSERDRQEIEQSTESLARILLHHYPYELPDSVVFPDKSARSLVYLIDPIFDKVASTRGVSKPHYFYIFPDNAKNKNTDLLNRIITDAQNELDQLEKFGDGGQDRSDVLKTIELCQRSLSSGELSQASLAKRAAEIKSYSQRLSGYRNPEIIIIDEYIFLGGTVEALKRAFSYDIPFYALMANHEFVAAHGFTNVYWGEEDSYTYRTGHRPVGFDYRDQHSNSSGVVEPKLPRQHILPDPERDSRKISQIRREMKSIGLSVTEKI